MRSRPFQRVPKRRVKMNIIEDISRRVRAEGAQATAFFSIRTTQFLAIKSYVVEPNKRWFI